MTAMCLVRETEMYVDGACGCCGDFNVMFLDMEGTEAMELWRWESGDPKLAERYTRGGTTIKVPRGALLKDMEITLPDVEKWRKEAVRKL